MRPVLCGWAPTPQMIQSLFNDRDGRVGTQVFGGLLLVGTLCRSEPVKKLFGNPRLWKRSRTLPDHRLLDKGLGTADGGCSSMVECQLSRLAMRVRPLPPAPLRMSRRLIRKGATVRRAKPKIARNIFGASLLAVNLLRPDNVPGLPHRSQNCLKQSCDEDALPNEAPSVPRLWIHGVVNFRQRVRSGKERGWCRRSSCLPQNGEIFPRGSS